MLVNISIVSEGVLANKNDFRYTIGYEAEPGKIIPLYIKTPKNCTSSGISRYNENSPYNMGFNVSEDLIWIVKYQDIWSRVEELMVQKLTNTPLKNAQYINPKLICWNDKIKTYFQNAKGDHKNYNDIGYCYATGVLKIGGVYKQGLNFYMQIFLKEVKYTERDIDFKSQLSDEDDGYDIIF